MTRDEKMQVLKDWQFSIQDSNELIAPVREVLIIRPESPINEAVNLLGIAFTRAASKLVSDKGGWLYWYAMENDFGKKGLSAGFKGHEKPIKTLDDLLDLIEQ